MVGQRILKVYHSLQAVLDMHALTKEAELVAFGHCDCSPSEARSTEDILTLKKTLEEIRAIANTITNTCVTIINIEYLLYKRPAGKLL